ncbi:MAG: hypothetical protein ACREM2_09710, partial [Vulcanimicrobiaceae bacterium]
MMRARGEAGAPLRLTAALALAAAVLALLLAFRAPLERALVAGALDLASGDRIAFSRMDLQRDRARFEDVAVRRNGLPLLSADALGLRYDLQDLLPGGRRRFGLVALTLERPRLELHRDANGAFDLGFAGGSGGGPAGRSQAAWNFEVQVRDGSVTVDDPYRRIARARRLSLAGLALQARIDGAGRSSLRASGALAGAPGARLTLRGTLAQDGTGLAELQAAQLPLVGLVDYLANTPSAAALAGTARKVALVAYAFGGTWHLGGSFELQDGAMRIPGLVPPARGMSGPVAFADGGLFTGRVQAEIGGIPVRLAGGIYDWRDPRFRLGVLARAPLAQARGLFRFSAALPVAGPLRDRTLIEGPVGDPLVASEVRAAQARYDRYPLRRLQGLVVYRDGTVALGGIRGRYGGLSLAVDGSLLLGADEPAVVLAGSASGPARAI